ncbi:MAG: methyltransferase domain-containing protein [Pseudomonadales bacterium]|nr:methyltransferase domain-containing protein [Pseudomonadales bacterium]
MQLIGPSDQAIEEEMAVIQRLVPLEGVKILELGCGAAEKTKQISALSDTVQVTAAEIDQVQHAKNLETKVARVTFKSYGAETIHEPDNSYDVVMMFKSLHHVDLHHLDDAFAEIVRVLKPGGLIYISEPVFAGAYNEVIRVFHDEEAVRLAAFEAIQSAVDNNKLELVTEHFFKTLINMRSFEQLKKRFLNVSHTDHNITSEQLKVVQACFESNRTPEGYLFEIPNRIDLLRAPS